MAVDFRPARASDVDALVAIEQAVFVMDRLSRRSFNRLLASRSATIVIADILGAVAGYCVVLFRERTSGARLYSIAIAPGYAGRGIGRRLVKSAEQETRARGRKFLRLEVREDNRRAIAIYDRAGFQRIGVIMDYYEDGMTALRMAKMIENPGVSIPTKATLGGDEPLSRATGKASRQAVS